ncbi:33631_t:CDS:2, partial [Racocetra persica]
MKNETGLKNMEEKGEKLVEYSYKIYYFDLKTSVEFLNKEMEEIIVPKEEDEEDDTEKEKSNTLIYDGYNEYKGRHHPIENVGSGYLRHKKLKSLAKILSLNEKKPVERLALIDEPELFLHPSLIGDIANSIKELEKKGVTLIMTTHSPFFLSQFIHEKGVNLAIAKGEGGGLSKLLYFSEIIENAKRIIVEATSLRSKIPEFDGIEVIPIFNEDENLVKRAGPMLIFSRLLSQREKEEKKDKERNLKKEKPFQNCRHATKCTREKLHKPGKEVPTNDILPNDNLIIKGNNLLSLYSLKGKYQGKIKLIYIDPPYNPDIAKKLLTSDGCLIVAIDKNEQAELTVLLKEIFRGYEIHVITIVHNPRGAQGANFSYTHEYAIFVIPEGKKTIGGESLRTDAKNCFHPIIVENEKVISFGEVVADDYHPEKQTTEKE